MICPALIIKPLHIVQSDPTASFISVPAAREHVQAFSTDIRPYIMFLAGITPTPINTHWNKQANLWAPFSYAWISPLAKVWGARLFQLGMGGDCCNSSQHLKHTRITQWMLWYKFWHNTGSMNRKKGKKEELITSVHSSHPQNTITMDWRFSTNH